jgi:dsDNA-specific endonuclease/ATPase MutS2
MSSQSREHRTAPLMQLIDDLEMIVTSARRIPGTNRITVDEQHLVNLIDEVRVSLPVELQEARRIVQERQHIVVSAQDEARAILETAKTRADYLVSEAGVLREARQQGEQRLREAAENAQRTRSGVSQYAISVLDDVEKSLRDQLHELERARLTIEDRERAGV